MHVRMEALSGMVGNCTTFHTDVSRRIFVWDRPALRSHSLFVPTALEDHNRGVRNTALKEVETGKCGITRAEHQTNKRTHSHVVTLTRWLVFEAIFSDHSVPHQIILWLHGPETVMVSFRTHQAETAIVFACTETLKTT